MTETIGHGLRKCLPREPQEFDGFAIPNATSFIEKEEAASVATRSGRAVDAVCTGPENIGPQEIDRLYCAFAQVTPENHPRTARLLASGTRRNAQKVIEEAGEVALEAVKRNRHGIVCESADLLYHLIALWRRVGIDPEDIWTEMHRRAELLGIAEKLPKNRNRDLNRDLATPAVAAGSIDNAE